MGDVLDSVSLLPFAKFEITTFGVAIHTEKLWESMGARHSVKEAAHSHTAITVKFLLENSVWLKS